VIAISVLTTSAAQHSCLDSYKPSNTFVLWMLASDGEIARVKMRKDVYVSRHNSEDGDMTWIKTIPPAAADPELAQCYEGIYALYPPEYTVDVPALLKPDGTSDSITAAHSLIPEAMRHAMSAYAVLLTPDLPLARRQHEMIATVVSALNSCFY
jgi:hypothetical protein